jgi:hypothetical protein
MKVKTAKQESGLVFVTVVAFIFLSLAMVMVLNKKVCMFLAVAEHETITQMAQEGQYVALARALTLLQTGTPLSSPSAYSITLAERPGNPAYAVTYEKVAENSWSVNISSLIVLLPSLPDSF